MLFLRGLTIGITMVPSRLRHPWDFYSKRIFLTLFFFFSKRFFYHCDKRQCCKGRNCTRHEEGDNKPHPGQMVSGRLVFEGCDGAFGLWSQRSWWTCEHCNPVWWLCGACAQPCASEIPDCTTNFFYFLGFLEEKVSAVLTSAWDRGHTQREESHSRQVPLSSPTSASLQW